MPSRRPSQTILFKPLPKPHRPKRQWKAQSQHTKEALLNAGIFGMRKLIETDVKPRSFHEEELEKKDDHTKCGDISKLNDNFSDHDLSNYQRERAGF